MSQVEYSPVGPAQDAVKTWRFIAMCLLALVLAPCLLMKASVGEKPPRVSHTNEVIKIDGIGPADTAHDASEKQGVASATTGSKEKHELGHMLETGNQRVSYATTLIQDVISATQSTDEGWQGAAFSMAAILQHIGPPVGSVGESAVSIMVLAGYEMPSSPDPGLAKIGDQLNHISGQLSSMQTELDAVAKDVSDIKQATVYNTAAMERIQGMHLSLVAHVGNYLKTNETKYKERAMEYSKHCSQDMQDHATSTFQPTKIRGLLEYVLSPSTSSGFKDIISASVMYHLVVTARMGLMALMTYHLSKQDLWFKDTVKGTNADLAKYEKIAKDLDLLEAVSQSKERIEHYRQYNDLHCVPASRMYEQMPSAWKKPANRTFMPPWKDIIQDKCCGLNLKFSWPTTCPCTTNASAAFQTCTYGLVPSPNFSVGAFVQSYDEDSPQDWAAANCLVRAPNNIPAKGMDDEDQLMSMPCNLPGQNIWWSASQGKDAGTWLMSRVGAGKGETWTQSYFEDEYTRPVDYRALPHPPWYFSMTVSGIAPVTLSFDKGFVKLNGTRAWTAFPAVSDDIRTYRFFGQGIAEDGVKHNIWDGIPAILAMGRGMHDLKEAKFFWVPRPKNLAQVPAPLPSQSSITIPKWYLVGSFLSLASIGTIFRDIVDIC